MNEPVLFEDGEVPIAQFLSVHTLNKPSPHVVVNEGRLKINDDSYSLGSCVSVKTEFVRKPRSYWPILQIVICIAFLSLFILLALVTYLFVPYPKPFRIGDVFQYWFMMAIPWFFAVRAFNRYKVDSYRDAFLVLMGSAGEQRLYIGCSRPNPDASLENRMRNIGYEQNEVANWKESYAWNAKRAQMISEAVGSVIARKTIAHP